MKKGEVITIFSDFMPVRNIFYSTNNNIISSSFSSIEEYIGTGANNLEEYKVFELFAMRQILYAGLLGNGTIHKDILRLRPYEYIKIDIANNCFSIGTCKLHIDNRKIANIEHLSSQLINNLKNAIHQPDLREEKIGATITGGYDSRLIAAIAANYYSNLRLRISVSSNNAWSKNDLKIAQKISKKASLQLDVYHTNISEDENDYFDLTEGFSPIENVVIARLIKSTNLYTMGLDGTFGTELFSPIAFTSVDVFISSMIRAVQNRFSNCEKHLERFSESLHREFHNIENHYDFTDTCEPDLIRMLFLYNTVSSFSFIRSSYNIYGMQMEPYFTMPVIETAFKVPHYLMGNRKRIGGTGLVQKKAMSVINYNLGKIMTFGHFDLMLPLSIRTLPHYGIGYLKHIAYWVRQEVSRKISKPWITEFDSYKYTSDGWNRMFVRRIKERYCNEISIKQSST